MPLQSVNHKKRKKSVYKYFFLSLMMSAQLAEAVEYTNCISVEG